MARPDRSYDTAELYRIGWPLAVDFAARRLGNLEEAEVVAQEALIRALDVATREVVRSFPALVLRIAHNLVIDRVRRRDWTSDRTDPDGLPSVDDPDGLDLGRLDLVRLRQALDRLPIELREVLELRYVDERSFSEIADDLSLSKNAVFARHQRALTVLREVFAIDADRRGT